MKRDMKAESDSTKVDLPQSLVGQLRVFEKRLCVAESVVAVCGALLGTFVTYVILFASDRFWNTPGWLRLGLTFMGGALFGWFAVRWMRHWWWKRRDSRKLARLVQEEYGRMGDRLLGAVELARGDTRVEHFSPALCRAAVKQVAQEASGYDFRKAVRMRTPHLLSASFLLVFVAVVSVFFLWPEAGWNALSRWAKPLSEVERYTFVSVSEIPDTLIVPHGEKFQVSCELAEESMWRPTTASCRLENQPRIETHVARGTVVFDIPGQTQDGILHIRIGDMTKDVRVCPKYRPELGTLSATVALPQYLKRPGLTIKIGGGRAEFLRGSDVEFLGNATRSLQSAELRLRPAAESETAAEGRTESLVVNGSEFSSQKLKSDGLGICEFVWTDSFNLSEAQPYVLKVASKADEPPLVECSGVQRTIAILEDEIVKLTVRAEDDYGLKDMWVNWTCVGSEERGVPSSRGTATLSEGSPETIELEADFSFSPIALDLAEETMTVLRAYASDYLPGRKPSMSVEYRIYVLSKAQHAKFIQQGIEEVQARIEELAREQGNLVQDVENISGLPQEQRDSERATSSLREQEYAERQNAQQLENLAGDVEKLMQEALRNSDIKAQSLREWAELSEAMKDLAGGEMSQAANSLQQSQQGKGEGRAQDIEKAIEHARKALEALREMEQEANESLENSLASSFVNRLRAAASHEMESAAELEKLLPVLIGVTREDLTADQREKVDKLAGRHDGTRKRVGYIEDDLAGFYSRTRLDEYRSVLEEMASTEIVKKLDRITGLIKQNVGIEASTGARKWAEKLNEWADALTRQSSGGGGGGGGGGEELAAADIEVLIALMRSRTREESLRDQTRLLQETKDSNRHYRSAARKLARIQGEIADTTRPLERKARHRQLRRLVEKVGGEMMNAAVFLKRPQTDASTIAIETEIIELLSSAISSASQSSSAAQGMMNAMGMQSAQGGGSNQGGEAGANANVAGDGGGQGVDNRGVDKTGGIDPGSLPAEFRDILKAYFNAIEDGLEKR